MAAHQLLTRYQTAESIYRMSVPVFSHRTPATLPSDPLTEIAALRAWQAGALSMKEAMPLALCQDERGLLRMCAFYDVTVLREPSSPENAAFLRRAIIAEEYVRSNAELTQDIADTLEVYVQGDLGDLPHLELALSILATDARPPAH